MPHGTRSRGREVSGGPRCSIQVVELTGSHAHLSGVSRSKSRRSRCDRAGLATEPQLLSFAAHLQTRHDPLRRLPAIQDCGGNRLSEASLQNLSDEELSWLHRAQWAARGSYRFSDPKVQAYFEGFVWYAPIPKAAWRARATKKFRENPDAPLLKRLVQAARTDGCQDDLELILKTERSRGLASPAL